MTTESQLIESTWNTYDARGYTRDVANDQASAGGVHLHQVRRVTSGWQTRICQSNGSRRAYGSADLVSTSTGEALFARAKKY